MKIRDMRKEPKESLPTFDMLAANDVFEFIGGAFACMKMDHETYWSFPSKGPFTMSNPAVTKVRRLKATLVLEDEGTASE